MGRILRDSWLILRHAFTRPNETLIIYEDGSWESTKKRVVNEVRILDD